MMLHEQGVGSGPGKGRFQRIIVQILAELHFVVYGRKAVVEAEIIPPVPEAAAVHDEGLAAGADVILHHCAHRARAGTGIDNGAPCAAMDEFQQHPFGFEIDSRKLVGAHIDERLGSDRVYIAREYIGLNHNRARI